MSKAVLISIRPEWCEKIANGAKTIEVRKTRPKLDTPFKCYIYCTNTRPYLVWGDVFRGNWETEFTHLSGYNRKHAEEIWDVFNGHVIGEFVCDKIQPYSFSLYAGEFCDCGEYDISVDDLKASCLTHSQLESYGDAEPLPQQLYGWHISDLVIYDTPKELGEFSAVCKYKQDDGTCPTRRIACSYQTYDYNQDGSINITECGKRVERPPQSWCYVEEII